MIIKVTRSSKITPELEKDIVRMHRELKNMVYIGRVLGYNPQTISKVLHKHISKEEMRDIGGRIEKLLDGRLSRERKDRYLRDSVRHLMGKGQSVEDISYTLHLTEEQVRSLVSSTE